jgi:hypothetical protein
MKKIYKTITGILIAATFIFSMSSCNDELTTSSSKEVSNDVLLTSSVGLNMLLRSAYQTTLFGFGTGGQGEATYVGIPGLNLYYDLSGEDVVVTKWYGMAPEDTYQFTTNRTSASGSGSVFWRMMYLIINQANAIIDAVPEAGGTQNDLNAVEGQAKALRGICYFHLMLNYQQTYAIAKDKRGVILRTSPKQPLDLEFSTVQQCYDQIVKDLSEAKTLLSEFNRSEKWQINADVASGHLARVYQVMGNWNGALTEATNVYNKYNRLMTKAEWCGGHDDISVAEVIWAVINTSESNSNNTEFAYWHNQDPSYGENMSDGPIYNYLACFVDKKFVDLFDNTDYRGTKCIKTANVTDADEMPVMFWHRTNALQDEWKNKWAYNKFKYYGDDGVSVGQKNLADYSLMRSSEILLIKAEAEANLGNPNALTTLNTLQSARQATLTTTTSKNELLEAIYVERRKELLGEGVTGMYDLVRLQKDLVRYEDTDANPGGHFFWGLTNLDAAGDHVAKLPSNDYRFFCQIPTVEFANNRALDPLKDQNPSKGQ